MKHDETTPNAAKTAGQGLPPLVMLRAFEAAGRTGSMRRASEDIGVSHTVISRHIANLEHWIGRKLVLTGPRGVRLTAEGESLLAAVSQAFGIIARTTTELRPRRLRGRLRIWCIAGLATRWLTPRLSELQTTLGPEVDIELRATDGKPDLLRREAEVLIGFAVVERLPEGAVRLVRPRMFPVASPRWLQKNAPPADATMLAQLPLLHEVNHVQWLNWFAAEGVIINKPLTGPKLSDASIGFDASLAGQGIALVNELMASDELRSGALVELFKSRVELGTYYLLTDVNRRDDPVLTAFSSWIQSQIAQSLHSTLPKPVG